MYTKKYKFWRFWGCRYTFLNSVVKLSMRVRNRDYLPQTKFGKKSLKGVYPFWAHLYPKLPIFTILRL